MFSLKKMIKSCRTLNISSMSTTRVITDEKELHRNPCVARCINMIANSVASFKFKVYKNGCVIESPRLSKLLEKPNYNDGWSSFIESICKYYLIYGNCYIYYDGAEMHVLMPNKIEIVPGVKGVPKAFNYEIDGDMHEYINDGRLPKIGHFKSFNPSCHWYGASNLSVIRDMVGLYNSITAYNAAVIHNGGRPSGFVHIKDNAMPMSKEQQDRLRNAMSDYMGANNAGKVVFIEGGDLEWKPVGTAQEGGYVDVQKFALGEIAATLGVPASLMSGSQIGESTRSNYQASIELFNEYTVLPIARKIFDFLNNWIVCLIEPGAEIKVDLDDFVSLHDKHRDRWDMINSAGFLTDEEKRKLLGLSEI